MKDRHGNEFVLVPATPTEEMLGAGGFHCIQGAGPVSGMDKRQACDVYTAAIAAAPKFEAPEVTDIVAADVELAFLNNGDFGRDAIAAVQSVIGPTLGLVELREPTPEECKKIERQWSRILDSVSETQEVRAYTCGRAMFDAVAAYLRGELK